MLPAEAAMGHSKCVGNIVLRRVVSVPFRNLCYFLPQAWGLALMEKLPSSGAKDWKGLRMKRPLWTGHSNLYLILGSELCPSKKGVERGAEVKRLVSTHRTGKRWLLPRSIQAFWLKSIFFPLSWCHCCFPEEVGNFFSGEVLGNGRCLLKFVEPWPFNNIPEVIIKHLYAKPLSSTSL